ncbi:hypothetical protein B0H16DRAFT_1507529 [Mycena metata]|uniref:Uncharacterized protein n=1 Tax=Mycena metata TaxID=1033252 RepID=A0AAD7K052_9AGAR|nr:hypothetical protein B0H16DRAFT_1507529 [Mycena metata]
MRITTVLSTIALLSPALAVSINNTLYIIGNAETPSLDLPGLTPIGLRRAQDCIPPIFADLNLGLIISCKPNNKTGTCMSANDTAVPLAASLGLVPDNHCATSSDSCVSTTLTKYAKNSTQAVLVVWDSAEMDDLLEGLDIDLPGGDDDDDNADIFSFHADLLLIKNLKQTVIETSMNCTGIDGPAPDDL